MAKSHTANGDDCIIIKKYANRRLYNTQTSSYITLDFLAKLTREGKDFKVIDAKTGDDITHNILTQIIMEEETSGQQMLPVSFLRELISLYGNSMQSMVPHYLEASMDAFRKNQQKFQTAVEGTIANGPLAQIAKQNIAMFEAASTVFSPRNKDGASDSAKSDDQDEIDALKAQVELMQQKLDKLAGK